MSVLLYCTASCISWSMTARYALTAYDVTKMPAFVTAQRYIALFSFIFQGGWGVLPAVLALGVLASLCGAGRLCRALLAVLGLCLPMAVLTERLAAARFLPAHVPSAQFYLTLIAGFLWLFAMMGVAALYQKAFVWLLGPQRPVVSRHTTGRCVLLAAGGYVLWVAAICGLMLLSSRLTDYYLSAGISAASSLPLRYLHQLETQMVRAVAYVGPGLILPAGAFLYIVARAGKLAAALSWGAMSLAAAPVVCLFAYMTGALGFPAPGAANYIELLLPCAAGLLCALAAALLAALGLETAGKLARRFSISAK